MPLNQLANYNKNLYEIMKMPFTLTLRKCNSKGNLGILLFKKL
jgi:hypothetical protein